MASSTTTSRVKLSSTKLTILGIIVGLLLLAAIYYLFHQENDGRDSPLIGDRVCGQLSGDAAQDACCSEAHSKDVTVQCLGSWQYFAGEGACNYVCNSEEPNETFCTQDVKLCPDGTEVGRNPTNNCMFYDCPGEDSEVECAAGGGTWKEFSNGCADYCGKEVMLCLQAVSFGCDCSSGCWNGTSCISS